jgi:hypothetical protein
MSTSTLGANETAAQTLAALVFSGGATVHLLGGGETLNYSDTSTELNSKSDATASLAESDVSISTPSSFSGVTTATLTTDLSFGSLSIGTVDQIVIQNATNQSRLILADEPNDPNLTGEDVTLPSGTTLYRFGNP